MRIYRNAIVITFLITIISVVIAFIFNFYTNIDAFWCNLFLGVFGSGLLTFITSVISYCVERRKTFEGFSYNTKAILHELNKYQTNWSLDEKVEFFLNFHDFSLIEWDRYYGEFALLFDWKKENTSYIYSKIYKPLSQIDHLINFHTWHFRWHKDGSGRNESVISRFVKEIEDLIIETTKSTFLECSIPTEDNAAPVMTSTRNRIVQDISTELNEKYYKLMYGSRIYKKSKVAEDK